MAEVTNNIVTKGLKGKIDRFVFKQKNGKTFQTKLADRSKVTYNNEQIAYRDLFAAAARHASEVLHDPRKLAVYLKKGNSQNQVYDAALKDYMKDHSWKKPVRSTVQKAFNYLQKFPGLHDRQVKALRYLISRGSLSNADYRKMNKISKASSTRELTDLVNRGAISSNGIRGAGAKYVLADSDEKKAQNDK